MGTWVIDAAAADECKRMVNASDSGSAAIIAADTCWRVPSSSTNREPLRRSSSPPDPRRSSAHSVLVSASGCAGSTNPVGWTCTSSICTTSPPARMDMWCPSPVHHLPLVVASGIRSGRYSCSSVSFLRPMANPPVASTTAGAVVTPTVPGPFLFAAAWRTPDTRPAPSKVRSTARVFFSILKLRYASAFAKSESVISAPAMPFDGR
eukprot:gene4469-biopygen4399